MKSYLKILGCLLLLLALTGCMLDRQASGELYEANGYSDLEHGNFFRGHFTYYEIKLGSEQHPTVTLPDFTLKLPNGKVICSRDFSIKNLRTPGDALETETNGLTVLRMNCASFTFSRDKCIEIKLSESGQPLDIKNPPVAMGNASGKEFEQMPISQEFFVKVFGPVVKKRTFLPPI
jgi:hypothetical protein